MATVSAQHSTAFWYRWAFAAIAVAAALTVAIVLIVSAATSSGGSSPGIAGLRHGSQPVTLCVSHGGAKVC